ncbi:hypothetical protein SAY86_013575 [Trapa natans]|uniref:Uncharacterized protein n=1 Tax=Trapa natans TaxID=22666 RepID=A0AAN7QQM5_TRANT|nr:hypothetical protein SAY86_013575 [Trapa natans]
MIGASGASILPHKLDFRVHCGRLIAPHGLLSVALILGLLLANQELTRGALDTGGGRHLLVRRGLWVVVGPARMDRPERKGRPGLAVPDWLTMVGPPEKEKKRKGERRA